MSLEKDDPESAGGCEPVDRLGSGGMGVVHGATFRSGSSRTAENHDTLCETDQMIDSPPLLSPEQFTGTRPVGPAVNLFSHGALPACSAHRRGPFGAGSLCGTAFRGAPEAPEPADVPGPLHSVLARCLVREAAQRPEVDLVAAGVDALRPESDPPGRPAVSCRGRARRAPRMRMPAPRRSPRVAGNVRAGAR